MKKTRKSPLFLTMICSHETGWWYTYLPTYPSEKWWSEFVSWDDESFPTEWKVIKFMFQTTNRPLFMINEQLWTNWGSFFFIAIYCHVWLEAKLPWSPQNPQETLNSKGISAQSAAFWAAFNHKFHWLPSLWQDQRYSGHPKRTISLTKWRTKKLLDALTWIVYHMGMGQNPGT